MLAGDREPVPARARAREGGVGVLDDHLDLAAAEAEVVVAAAGARQEPCLAEHLEAVADAEHAAPLTGELGHGLHHRREAGDRAGAEVVAVGEAAGDDDGVDALQVAVAVPEDLRVAVALTGLERIDFVTGSGKPDDAETGQSTATTS